MKIEIELSEVEYLRSELEIRKTEVKELETKLKELSEIELKQRAVSLSWRLLDNYLAAVFTHLGFNNKNDTVIVKENLEHYLGKSWWNSERIKFELGATITTEFRTAFLKIGIIPKEEVEKDDDYKL